MKLALGTAQFGLDYGISNSHGQVKLKEVDLILQRAHKAGVQMLDTAMAYGQSESILGQVECSKKFNVITKIPKLSTLNQSIYPIQSGLIEAIFQKSLNHLNQNKLYGLMCHDGDDLLGENGEWLYSEFKLLQSKKLVSKIGASVYSPEQAEKIINQFDINIIQIPLNIFDQRFMQSGLLNQLKNKNIEVHVRSIILQGVLLMTKLPDFLSPLTDKINKLDQLCKKYNCTRLDLIWSFINQIEATDKAVIGVTSVRELNQWLEAANQSAQVDKINWSDFQVEDERLISPVYWPKR